MEYYNDLIEIEFTSGKIIFLARDGWHAKAFSELQEFHKGIIVKMDGEHPSTWGMTYDQIEKECIRIGQPQNEISDLLRDVKRIRGIRIPPPQKAYCINLSDRIDRWKQIQDNWKFIMPVERIDAVDRRAEKDGMRGVYESHLKTMINYLASDDFKHGYPLMILEDDCVPCLDFTSRLFRFWPTIPASWDIFLPGFWPNQFSEWEPVNEFIFRAKKQVIGNHCWCIRTESLPKVIEFFASRPHRHLDEVMRELQQHFEMYIAIPSFAHQNGQWSDTSDQPSYTDPTRKYFKERL